MRINVNEKNQPSSVTFGYNKVLNKKVLKILGNNSSDINKKLIELNNFCNKTEDLIDIRKKGSVSTIETDALIDLLIDVKSRFVDSMEKFFPSLNYAKRESNYYAKESIQKSKDWKQELSNIIKPVEEEQPFLLKEYVRNTDSPEGLSSILGREQLKKELNDKIIFPIKYPEEAILDEKDYGSKFSSSVLLSGPPGCNKSFIAEAIAREADLPLFKINVDMDNLAPLEDGITIQERIFNSLSILSREMGKPSVLQIDGLNNFYISDAGMMTPESMSQITRLLNLIKTSKSKGIVVVSTIENLGNKSALDEIIKYSFGSNINVDLPDKLAIIEILKKNLTQREKGHTLLNSYEDLSEMAAKLNGFPDNAIKMISDDAALIAKNDGRRDIKKQDYIQAMQKSTLKSQSSKIGFSNQL